jgi:pilus assembly protein CpaF
MVLLAAPNLDQRSINKQIVSAINLIVQIRRFPDGKRRVESIAEIVGMEGQTILLQEIAKFNYQGKNEHGQLIGSFSMTSAKPKFYEKAVDLGISVPKF